jgi:hypothetical protein
MGTARQWRARSTAIEVLSNRRLDSKSAPRSPRTWKRSHRRCRPVLRQALVVFAEVHVAQCNLNRLALPPEVEALVLVADADPVGEQAAGSAEAVDQGISVQLVLPPAGQDINDLSWRAPAMVSAG